MSKLKVELDTSEQIFHKVIQRLFPTMQPPVKVIYGWQPGRGWGPVTGHPILTDDMVAQMSFQSYTELSLQFTIIDGHMRVTTVTPNYTIRELTSAYDFQLLKR